MEPETPDTPPEDSKVVDLAAKRRGRAAAGPSEDESPPSDSSGEGAPSKGKGGKREKKIDWGTFNFLLENFVVIYPTDTAWDREKRKQVKIANLSNKFGNDYVRMWKAAPTRKVIDEEDLVFDPTVKCGPGAINLYDGFAVEPVACDAEEVDPMLRLLEHLCSRCKGGDGNAGVQEVMQWVLRWLAYPLQHPGGKPRTALVFHGPQGTGKNLFFDVIRGIYGKYGVMVGQTEIEEKYNGWLSAKLLVIGNEVVSKQELFAQKNRLKWIISEAEKIPIRTMHVDTRWEQNHANVIFLSNESMPLVLEIGDRRFLVVYTPTPEDTRLYAEVRDFLADDGAAKFMHFLLQYPLGDFHEHTKPPMTQAKEELIELSMRPAERFMTEWVGGFLDLPMQVCSAEQLYKAFRRWCEDAGEKWPPARNAFTSQAKRWALERVEKDEAGRKQSPCLEYRISSPSRGVEGKSVRWWQPRGTGPLPGIQEWQWAVDAIEAYELPLSRFTRHRHGSEDHPPPPSGGKKGGSDAAAA